MDVPWPSHKVFNFMYKTYNTLIMHTKHDHMPFLVTACYAFNIIRAFDSLKHNN